MNVKLALLFITMDLLTIVAYPFVYIYGKLRKKSKPGSKAARVNILVSLSSSPVGD